MGDACGMNTTWHKTAGTFVLVAGLLAVSALCRAGETVGQGYPARGAATVQRASASASVPAAVVVDTNAGASGAGDFESQPLAFPASSRRAARPDTTRNETYSLFSMVPALFYVLLVCGVFTVILYLAKKYLPGHRQLFSHPAMELLGRTHLDQKRYISLLRVGKRVIVLGISPDEISSLSEITDEEEITGILEVARPKTDAGLTLFQRMFQRHVVDAESAETRAVAAEKALEIEDQMSSLRERVRAIRQKEEPSRHVDAIG